MKRVGIISFPGTNNEVESVRAIKRAGMEPHCFKWNDSFAGLRQMDAYFIPGGFSYEDRGRSGMIAAREPIMEVLKEESKRGKTVIGHCNGAQILIESGMIPLGDALRMSLARNAVQRGNRSVSPGFINEWIWITPTCEPGRCATSNWDGALQIPMAHGEGRFVTKDPELIKQLETNNQIAFAYTDEHGKRSMDERIVPNGSTIGIAGICNPEGNVVALMPHPERTANADPYFASLRLWLENPKKVVSSKQISGNADNPYPLPASRPVKPMEIFIDTIITNNEERTVEQALRRILPDARLRQYRYVAATGKKIEEILETISIFNPNKEVAYVRQNGDFFTWNTNSRKLEPVVGSIFKGIALLRRDEPDTSAQMFGAGSQTGVCYDCRGVNEQKLYTSESLEILANPHASTLEVFA